MAEEDTTIENEEDDDEIGTKKKKTITVNAASLIRKKFGRSIEPAGEKYKSLPEGISTGSILLNSAIGPYGGYPVGAVIEVFGWEGAGKTLLLYLAFAEAQKRWPNRPCVLIDAERQFQFQARWAASVGVDISKLIVIPISTAEEGFDIAHSLILGEHEVDAKTGNVVKVTAPGNYAIIGFDSVTQMVSQVDATKGMNETRQRGTQATAIGLGLKKVSSAMARFDVDSKTILFFINQLRKNPNQMFGCMHASTKIHTTNDIYSSSSFVKHKIKETMVSYNEKTDTFDEFEPLEYYNNGMADRSEFIKVCFEVPTHRMYQKLICTRNHKIFTKNGWVEAQNLAIGDELLSYCNNPLSNEEEQILIGSMLADGFMQTRGCLSASISFANSEQPEYLMWKIKQLKSLKFYSIGKNSFRTESEMFLLKYYKHFYENDYSEKLFKNSGKHYRSFTSEIIDKVDLLGLAIFYLDDGSIWKERQKASISMRRFDYLDTNVQIKLFESLIKKFKQFDVDVELDTEGHFKLKIINIDYFSKLICQFVIPEMQYKLLDEHINNYQELKHIERVKRDKIYTKVLKICEISDKEAKCLTKYDIQTPVNTYMVGSSSDFSGVVVHNSPEYRTGGNALPFYNTIALKVAKVWKSEVRDEVGNVLSHDVKVTFDKNKAGSMPEDAIVFTLRHDGSGVNNEQEMFSVALMNGIIKEFDVEKDGKTITRYNFVNTAGEKMYDDIKDFGKKKFYTILEEKPKLKETVECLIKDGKFYTKKETIEEEVPDSAVADPNEVGEEIEEKKEADDKKDKKKKSLRM